MIPKSLKAWLALTVLLGGIGLTIIVNVRNYEQKWGTTVRDRGAATDKAIAKILANQESQRVISNDRHKATQTTLNARQAELSRLSYQIQALTTVSSEGVEELARQLTGRVATIQKQLIQAEQAQTLSDEMIKAFGDSLSIIKRELARLELNIIMAPDTVVKIIIMPDTTNGKWWNPFD